MKQKDEKKRGVKERKPNYKEYRASVEDIQTFLMGKVLLRHNVITRRVEYRYPGEVSGETTEWQPMNDRVVNTLWAELSLQKQVSAQDVYRVMDSDFVPDFHPFRSYLEHLPPWNGEDDHLLAMSMTVQVKGGTDEQLRFAEYLKKWLVAMVAGWIDPQVVNNVILVLIGAQGSYKTTWFNYLLPPELRQYFYTKTNASRMGRDDLLTLAQYGLVCCEELDTMRPSELNQLKAAVTMPTIDERAAYAHYAEHRHHIASFCGTGNNVPFEVDSILSPRSDPFDYENIYAQAYALYRQGFQYWFSQSDIQQLAQHNQQFEAPKIEHELIDIYFRKPSENELGEFMPVARALQIVGGSISQKISDRKLGRAFADQGYQFKRTNMSRGYIVVQRSSVEIQERQKRLASDEVTW